MKSSLISARAYLHAHPTYIVAAGLALAAIGNYLAGRPAQALDSLYGALGVLGVRVAVGSPPKG